MLKLIIADWRYRRLLVTGTDGHEIEMAAKRFVGAATAWYDSRPSRIQIRVVLTVAWFASAVLCRLRVR